MLLIILGTIGWLMVIAKLSGYVLSHHFPCLTQSTRKEEASHNG